MASVPYSGAPSAVGYQHQTWWALYELLRSGIDRPDAAITLELYDDVAWEENGTPTQLLQLKHHQNTYRALTDTSTDLWRTLRVWMNTAIPGDAAGAQLLLVTTQTASSGTAVAALRPDTFDIKVALTGLEAVAHQATSQQTELARTQFLTLNSSDRRAFISRIRIIDSSPCINDIQKLVRARLLWALPTGREELFLAMVWNWWDEQSLTMLQGRRRSVDIGTARTAIAGFATSSPARACQPWLNCAMLTKSAWPRHTRRISLFSRCGGLPAPRAIYRRPSWIITALIARRYDGLMRTSLASQN